jgi:hypothetical protein
MNFKLLEELNYEDLDGLRIESSLITTEDYEDNIDKHLLKLKKSIKRYTSLGHTYINKYIIKNDSVNKEIEEQIKDITESIELVKSTRLTSPFFVWRGLNNFSENKEYYDNVFNLSKIKVINNLPFLSTSYSKRCACNFNWGILLKIYVDPKEDLNYILLENMRECELLFQKNTHFEYISEYLENDYKIIEVELKKGIV